MREKIYGLILRSDKRNLSYIYDIFISFTAVLSIMPIMFKREMYPFLHIERAAVVILASDYLLRFIVSDYIIGKGRLSFIIYPFTLGAVVDLVSLLPFGRIFRAFRIFKMLRYMDIFVYMMQVYKRVRRVLFTTLIIAVSYIFVTALFMFSAEGESFSSFFDALYWATTALTTVGYGDIYPVTCLGRLISMITSVFGIAVIALPSGVITANIIKELNKNEDNGSK